MRSKLRRWTWWRMTRWLCPLSRDNGRDWTLAAGLGEMEAGLTRLEAGGVLLWVWANLWDWKLGFSFWLFSLSPFDKALEEWGRRYRYYLLCRSTWICFDYLILEHQRKRQHLQIHSFTALMLDPPVSRNWFRDVFAPRTKLDLKQKCMKCLL